MVEVELEDYKFETRQQYCKCEKDGDSANVVCNYHYDVDNCQARVQQARGIDKTDDLIIKSRERSESTSQDRSQSQSRVARSLRLQDEDDEEVDDDYFNTEFVFNKDFKGQVRGGISGNINIRNCSYVYRSSGGSRGDRAHPFF